MIPSQQVVVLDQNLYSAGSDYSSVVARQHIHLGPHPCALLHTVLDAHVASRTSQRRVQP